MTEAESQFDPEQFALSYPDGIHRHWWQVARNHIVERMLRRIATPETPVLDVGCGRGIVVHHLKGRGQRCHGVELASSTPYPGVEADITVGTAAEDLPTSLRAEIEVALLLDVIEHLPAPEAFLGQLAEALPALRRVLITVPARPEAWSNYDRVFGHYRRYTRAMIDDLAGQLGWQKRACRYFFHQLYWLARLLTRLTGERPIQIRTPAPGPMSWLHRAVGWSQILEAGLVPRGCRGLSLIAVLELPGKR